MLQAIDIYKTFPGAPRPVLNGVNLTVERGEFVSITGRSGSGKSTLLNVISTLSSADSGLLIFEGHALHNAPEAEKNRLRAKDFAMIFQAHHLMPYLNAMENVLLPGVTGLCPVTRDFRERAQDLLNAVGLSGKENQLPGTLSGGEQQRVAIARSLAGGAKLLFADEPTGSLDAATADSIMELLQSLNRNGLTIVMVTHNPDYARMAGRALAMRDGRIETS